MDPSLFFSHNDEENDNYYNYGYESSHGYTQDASISPYGYTLIDGTSSFNLTPPFTTNEQTLTPEETTPVQQNLSIAIQRTTRENCKNCRFKTIQWDLNKYSICVLHIQTIPTSGFNVANTEIAVKHIFQETHGKPFRLETCWAIVKDTTKWYHYIEENLGVDECMRSPHGRLLPSSVNLSDDGSPFSQGLECPPGRKASKARKYKAKTDNVNLLSKDILRYETRSNKFYEHDVAMKATVDERKRNLFGTDEKGCGFFKWVDHAMEKVDDDQWRKVIDVL
ncbi:hypothetical protein Q3G72_006346 [Acer saccharum]|nr:hypothetical protein Q3G72_006346 [Acer saccharum]